MLNEKCANLFGKFVMKLNLLHYAILIFEYIHINISMLRIAIWFDILVCFLNWDCWYLAINYILRVFLREITSNWSRTMTMVFLANDRRTAGHISTAAITRGNNFTSTGSPPSLVPFLLVGSSGSSSCNLRPRLKGHEGSKFSVSFM